MVWAMEPFPPLHTMLRSALGIRPERLELQNAGAHGFGVSCEVGISPGTGENGSRTTRSQGLFFSPDTSHDTRSTG
jgi:hypothetical protein